MKVLKKQGLTFVLIMALVVTLTLGIIFMLPARTAKADDFTPDITVNSAKELKEAVLEVTPRQETPYKIRLGADIVIGTADDEDTNGLCTGAKNLIIDLNGHSMKHIYGWWVIAVNSPDGKLELIDTSADKTGLITNDVPYDALIYNYGTLITNVNMTNETRYFDGGSFNSYPMVQCTADPRASDVDDESYKTWWAKRASITVKGGTFHGGKSNEFFKLIDADLVIEDGTFLRDEDSNSVRSIFTANTFVWSFHDPEVNAEGKLFNDQTKPELRQEIKDKRGAYLDAYLPYRGCNVEIKGGNFIGSHGRTELITLNNAIKCNIPCGSSTYYSDLDMDETVEHKVSISGGMWGIDYSAYCSDGNWMRKFDPRQDIGPAGDYYIVDKVSNEELAATVSAADGPTKSFSSFDAAWVYATRNLDGARTVKAEQDAEIGQLNLWYGNDDTDALPGVVTLDLNGHKLIYSDLNPSINGSHAAIALGTDKNLGKDKTFKLIMKDSTPKQEGELIMKIETSSPSSEHGIHISNQYASFELQSGTIRQTGYFPDENTYTDPEGGNGSQNKAEAIFNIGESLKNVTDAIVTIKGGNILSEIYFGTEESHGELTSSPILIAWGDSYGSDYSRNVNFQVKENDTYGYSFPNKNQRFVFDLHDFVVEQGHTSVFSWDLKKDDPNWGNIGNTFEGLSYVTVGVGRFAFTNLEENDNYLAGGARHQTLGDAITAAKAADGIVSLLRSATITEAVTLEGITLDLDAYLGYTIELKENGSLTLKDGAGLRNGTLSGNVTIAGNATLQGVHVTGNVKVDSGTLTILSGVYDGTFTFAEGADAVISGGTFMGSQIKTLDNYFATARGAYIGAGQAYADDSAYEVKIAPNLAAQKWYNDNKSKDAFEITSTEEWNYFALYVSSGIDVFLNKTIKLTADLDFGYRPENTPAATVYALARNGEQEFFPAGNQTNRFNGTFDGANDEGGSHIIQGIHVTEINAGLFGGTNEYAKIDNITLMNSKFEGGSGIFDEFNTEKGWVFVGGIIAQGNQGHSKEDSPATGIKLQNVTIARKDTGKNIMAGGFIGQTWKPLYIKGIEIDGLTLDGTWKMGGIVGYTESTITLIEASIKNIETANGNMIGAVAGHANGGNTVIKDSTIIAEDSALVGTMYASGSNSDFIIEGADTYIVADKLVNNNMERTEESDTIIKFSSQMEEDGVHRTTVKIGKGSEEQKLEFQDSNGDPLPEESMPKPDENGVLDMAPLVGEDRIKVIIGGITLSGIEYNATGKATVENVKFTLYYVENGKAVDLENVLHGTLNLSVTLELSKCTVGKQAALITSYTFTGDDAKNFNFQLKDNQMFIEVEVTAATLQVSVNSNGEVEYNGFVGGENESVLGGELTINKVDNGDGTYTVTPSGLESENYNIVYVSSVVPAAAFESNSNALWIALAVVGSAVLLLGAVAVVYAVRKRKE